MPSPVRRRRRGGVRFLASPVSVFSLEASVPPTIERGDAPASSRLPAGFAAFPRRRQPFWRRCAWGRTDSVDGVHILF